MTEEVSLKPTENALKNLEEALKKTSLSDLERDGVIQRFEYCYELIWKLAQKILKDNEIFAETPRNVFRELGRLGWIDNVDEWMAFQKSRNETSHEYGETLAKKSFNLAQQFLPLSKKLYEILKKQQNGQ